MIYSYYNIILTSFTKKSTYIIVTMNYNDYNAMLLVLIKVKVSIVYQLWFYSCYNNIKNRDNFGNKNMEWDIDW